MKTKYLYIFLLFSLGFLSCIRMFVPEIKTDEQLLVVDAELTNAPGPYTVKLSKAAAVKQLSAFIPYENCKVKIEDDQGKEVSLEEKQPGNYQTDSSAFMTGIGRTYKLSIITPDGDVYESVPATLLQPIGIQSLYAELQHKQDPELFFGRDGYQFYLDAETPTSSDNYLMWRLQSTYKFRTDLELYAYYTDGKRHKVKDGDSLRTCYRTVDILDLYTLNTNILNQLEIKKVPLNYEDNYTKALSIRYCLKAMQYTINKEAFNYWNTIKKIRDMQGELYTQQPYQIKNNIKNITHPEKIALGYFTVAGKTEKRFFVNHPPVDNHFDVCTLNGAPAKYLDAQLKEMPELWPFFLVDPAKYGGDFWVDQECIDCRKLGVLEKPDFWVD